MGTGGQNCTLILWFNLGFIEVLHSSTAKTMGTGLQKNAHYKENSHHTGHTPENEADTSEEQKVFYKKTHQTMCAPKKKWRKNIERRKNQTLSGSNSTARACRFWCPVQPGEGVLGSMPDSNIFTRAWNAEMTWHGLFGALDHFVGI